MRNPPTFWSRPDGNRHPLAVLLQPLSRLYSAIVARKISGKTSYRTGVPVICVGNITMGGVGKTPFVSSLAEILSDMNCRPFILMRGYGGKEKGPHQVQSGNSAEQVGDEARMLSRHHSVIVSRVRPHGADLAVSQGADVIVMDDGFQNPSLHRDFSFLLIDGETGLGNALVFPAGPLRESAANAFKRADALVVMGERNNEANLPSIPDDMPVFQASIETTVPDNLSGHSVVAFSGIGRPEKFFDGLTQGGVHIRKTRSFADHHFFKKEEISALKSEAKTLGAVLVTTEKDFARLDPEMAAGIQAVPAYLKIDDRAGLEKLLKQVVGERI